MGMFGKSATPNAKPLNAVFPQKPPEPANPPKLGHFMQEKKGRVDTAFETLKFLEDRKWPKWHNTSLNANRFEYDKKSSIPTPTLVTTYKTEIIVSSEDSLTAAMRILKQLGPNRRKKDIPLVLSMAHAYCKGGGFLLGARAQEEDLCRRTDNFLHLQQAQYPLPEFGAHYAYPVSILRDSKHTNYAWLPETKQDPPTYYQFGLISAPAYEKPVINNEWREKMRQKVKCLLQACYLTGHRTLIFSAWGCGAFENPPEEVAGFFKQALEGPYKGAFDKVIFGLASNKREGNVGAFLDCFKVEQFIPRRS